MSEYTEVELPLLQQLAAQGWAVIDQGSGVPQDAAASGRTSFRQWWLPKAFREAVAALNVLDDGTHWLTAAQLDELELQFQRHPNRSLIEANRAVQQWLFKATVNVNEATGEADPVVRLIDFAHPERNRFIAVNQFRVDTPGCAKAFIIPDVVLFVNGLPLVVVECKKGSSVCANPMQEAFEQLRRYMGQRPMSATGGLKEGEPRLFHANLLVVRSSGVEADYGSISSHEEHFYGWKTLYPAPDEGLERLSAQQRLVAGLLTPTNLLQVLHTCTVFMTTEQGSLVKVVGRYQQFRAASKVMARLRGGRTAAERSGVVWHTQGSGKSLTMVFLARMLRASADLHDHKIILVNDRQDLEEQLGKTAQLIGGKVHVIASTQALRQHLASDSSDLSMVMVHKFQERDEVLSNAVAEALGTYRALPASQTFGVVNASERIVLMIDEAHRTQSSDLGDNLFEGFPNATRLAFTGTPLKTDRHGEKKTVRRFGEYIDTYKLLDAVDDGATLQILYEGRTSDTALNDKAGFDARFEDLFRDRTPEELEAIKRKYGTQGDLLEAKARIDAIALDLVNHYVDHILPNGFKAQVVCHSKLACVRYQAGIEAALAARLAAEQAKPEPDTALISRLAFLKTAVVISSDGTNEAAFITLARKQAARMKAVENFCKPFNHEEPDQAHTGIAFLIVCDMLLTGFDAPMEQVMYLDKRLREHTLLQAIARTNRVKKGKQRGYVVDYIGLANHLSEALTLYANEDEQQELAQGLKNINAEVPVLEERYQRLLQHFDALGVQGMRAFVAGEPAAQAAQARVVDHAVTALVDERQRADFEVYLKKFLGSLDVILPHPLGQPYRVPANRFGYILHVVKERYKDNSLNLRGAGEKVKVLINEHLVSLGINPMVTPVELLAPDFLDKLQQHADGNPRAKASEMEHALRKHCTVHHDEDPAFYKRLSEKVDALIDKHHDQWELLAQKLSEVRDEAVAGRQGESGGLGREAKTFHDFVADLVFEGGQVPAQEVPAFRNLMETLVQLLQETIDSIDFWQSQDKQKRLRGQIKLALGKTDMANLKDQRERVAVEVMKLARHRHAALLRKVHRP